METFFKRALSLRSLSIFACIGCVVAFLLFAFFAISFLEHYRFEQKLSSIELQLERTKVADKKNSANRPTREDSRELVKNALSQIHLLKLEKGNLELLKSRRQLSTEESARLNFLYQKNILSLSFTDKKNGEGALSHPVEVDPKDLLHILNELETTLSSAILIKRLYLEKIPSSSNYQLQLELYFK
jgi:hypothetical protein